MNSETIAADGYSIFVGDAVLPLLEKFLDEANHSKTIILVDENSMNKCLPVLTRNVPGLNDCEIIEIESGESSKDIQVCGQLWEALLDMDADRNSLLINLGGGVIGDLGGYVASCYMRGIDFIQLPTTLLSLVDASVGGKVGINHYGVKNLVGNYSMPKAVFAYPGFLNTLGKRHLINGFAEVIKHGLIDGRDYWEQLKSCSLVDPKELGPLISRSIKIKNEIVSSDFREQGRRKVLNFGYTIGHALESGSMNDEEVSLLHGEAVAVGMICASFISYKRGLLPHDVLDDITSFIFSIFGNYNLDPDIDKQVLELIKGDKKKRGKAKMFTLIKDVGDVVIDQECTNDEIKAALRFYRDKMAVTP